MLYRSKVKATDKEMKSISSSMNVPLIAIHCGEAAVRDFVLPLIEARERCHDLALKHGLPEVEGYYGLDLETGEFVSESPIIEDAKL